MEKIKHLGQKTMPRQQQLTPTKREKPELVGPKIHRHQHLKKIHPQMTKM
jgi:hypothetical protein